MPSLPLPPLSLALLLGVKLRDQEVFPVLRGGVISYFSGTHFTHDVRAKSFPSLFCELFQLLIPHTLKSSGESPALMNHPRDIAHAGTESARNREHGGNVRANPLIFT